MSREDALKSTRKIFLDNIMKGAPWLRLRLYSTTRSIKIMIMGQHSFINWVDSFFYQKTNVSFSFLSSIPSLTLFWSGGLLIHGDEQLTATRAGVRQSIHICALPNTTPDDDGGGLLLLVMLMAMMTILLVMIVTDFGAFIILAKTTPRCGENLWWDCWDVLKCLDAKIRLKVSKDFLSILVGFV